ncbi:hypothetical protein [Dyadobacter diqingensis]|uniref:hypothetical protein n=1 Tax=Dyadobacter diqingensis TaxID=2938121 RepID=UPI0020C38AC1|nr:hypothetical protein [Dyadobacter diqingensis]
MNTNRLVTYIAGPEVSWFLIYGFVLFLGSQNQPPTYSGNLRLENMSWLVLITAIVISFIPFLWIQENRGWLTFRTGLSGLAGIFFISTKLCEAIKYNDSRDSGVGTLYVMLIMLGFVILSLGLICAGLVIRFRMQTLPVLKWLAIIIGVILTLSAIVKLLAATPEK